MFRGRVPGIPLALAALAAVPSMLAPFFADDYLHIERAAALPGALWKGWVLPIDSAGAWWTPPGTSVEYFRPIVTLSFALDRLFYGASAAGYHFSNVAFHLATTWMVWLIARHVLGAGVRAIGAAALFAVHPCHTQAIAWISGRTDLLAAMLTCGAFLVYLRARPPAAKKALPLALGSLLFALALLAKEMAITLPLVILADAILRPNVRPEPFADATGEGAGRSAAIGSRRTPDAPGEGAGRSAAIGSRRTPDAPSEGSRRPAAIGLRGMPVGTLLLALGVAVGYIWVRAVALGGLRVPPTPFAHHLADPGFVREVATGPLLYLADLVLCVPPDPMVSLPFWRAHPLALATLGMACLAALYLVRARLTDRRALAWGLAWTGITLLPVLTLTVGEHFLYLPSVGFCIAAASCLPTSVVDMTAQARKTMAAAFACVVVVSAGRTLLFDAVALASSRIIAGAAREVASHPAVTHLFVANLPWVAALAFPHALRLALAPRAIDVDILSIDGSALGDPARSTTVFHRPDRIDLRRRPAFLDSYIERAFAGSRDPLRAGQTIARPSSRVTVVDAPGGHLSAFSVELRDPAASLVLDWNGHDLRELSPAAGPMSAGP